MSQVRLGELLVHSGVLSEPNLRRALMEMERSSERLGAVLLRLQLVDQAEMVSVLAEASKLPRIDLGRVELQREASEKVPADWARLNGIAPICYENQAIIVAVADPSNVGPLDEISFRTGKRVRPMLASEAELQSLMTMIYSVHPVRKSIPPPARNGAPPMPSSLPTQRPISSNVAVGHPSSPPPPRPSAAPPPSFPSAPPPASTVGGRRSSPPAARQSVPPFAHVSTVPVRSADDPELMRALTKLAHQQDAVSTEIQALFELCVQKGIIDRGEYLRRLQSMD